MSFLLVEEVGVVHGVVGAVDEQPLAVETEHRRLRHSRSDDLHLAGGVDRDRLAVLRTDEQRLGLALPEVAVVLPEVVEPRRTLLGAGDVDRRVGTGDRSYAVLRPQHRGTHVADVRVADRDQHDVAGDLGDRAVRAGRRGGEPFVQADLDRLPVHLVDEFTGLVVGSDGSGDTVPRPIEVLEAHGAGRARGQSESEGDHSSDQERKALHQITFLVDILKIMSLHILYHIYKYVNRDAPVNKSSIQVPSQGIRKSLRPEGLRLFLWLRRLGSNQ